MRTKILFFSILTLTFIFFSCEKEYERLHPIPNIRVNFSVNTLNHPELQTIGTPKYIISANGKKVGYKGHGIYLMRTSKNEIKAFDASCTYIGAGENHTEVKQHLTPRKGLPTHVFCTECGSIFDLFYGNATKESKATIPLREYKTSISGNVIRVSN